MIRVYTYIIKTLNIIPMTTIATTNHENSSDSNKERIVRLRITGINFSGINYQDPTKLMLLKFVGQIIAFDGLPCAGKTTFLEKLHEIFSSYGIPCIIYKEKVNKKHLAEFYRQYKLGTKPNTEAYPFQLGTMNSCISAYEDALKMSGRTKIIGLPHVCILDRPVWGNKIFEEGQYEAGNISEEQHDIYLETIISHGPYIFDNYIYLHVSAETCFNRILNVRENPEEKDVDLVYLKGLEKRYVEMVIDQIKDGDRSVFVVDNDAVFCNPKRLLEKLLQERSIPKLPKDTKSYVETPEKVAGVMSMLVAHYRGSK